MTGINTYVTIKGTKDGLVFLMDDTCSYQDLILELKNKLEKSHHHFLDGPLINVTVQLGMRYLNQDQQSEVKDLIRSKGNLVVAKLESQVVSKEEVEKARLQAEVQVIYKTVRSGQVYQCDGNVLVLGDVNPGGCVQANGSIYVMGALRGMVHAGFQGDRQAIIAASILQPTQLRIHSLVRRPPEDRATDDFEMEFAYIEEGQIVVEKLHHVAEVKSMFKRYV